MSTITQDRRSVQPRSRKPVVAELTLHINGVPYVVNPIAADPDNTKAFRLVKALSDAVYDCCLTNAGTLQCACPDFSARSGDQVGYRCKHLIGLVMVGLLDAPKVEAQPDPRVAYNDAREKLAAIAESEAVVRSEAKPPARVVPVFDREPYRIANIVAKGDACWLIQRPRPVPATLPAPADAREPRLLDEDGSPLETSREMAARHREEHAVKVAELMEGNPFMSCCLGDEPAPCAACIEAPSRDAEDEDPRYGPQDDGGGGWDAYDDSRWTLAPDAEMSMVEVVMLEAARYRGWGTDLGDLLAERSESLVGQIKALDARTPEQFRDRRDAHLDCAMREAEARMARARCCC